jgi:two-component system, chemotaxis family, protein-glutamate methylesterase/glutaminase
MPIACWRKKISRTTGLSLNNGRKDRMLAMNHTPKPLKVLVVDDTVVYRKIVSDVLSDLPDVEVVGTAHNGKAAMYKIKTLQPDLLTLDIEMPEMNGLEVLQQLITEAPRVGAIMLSTLTQEGGAMTMRALDLGAFDFIPKPQSGTMAQNREAIQKTLAPIIRAFARSRHIRERLRPLPSPAKPLATPPNRAERSHPLLGTRQCVGHHRHRHLHGGPQCPGPNAAPTAR